MDTMVEGPITPTPSNLAWLMSLLEWSWDKVASGENPTLMDVASWISAESYQSLAAKFLAEHDTLDEAVTQVIHWQAGQAGTVGAVTGFPGLLVAGVTIPLDIAGFSAVLFAWGKETHASERVGNVIPSSYQYLRRDPAGP